MEPVDIIVVGAGAAGCIVAARLAEAGHRVCVFEDGPKDSSRAPQSMAESSP